MKKILLFLTAFSFSFPAFSLVSNVCSEDPSDPHYIRSISDPNGDVLKTRIEICAHKTDECQQIGQNSSYNFIVVEDVQRFQSKYLRNTVGRHMYDTGKGIFAVAVALGGVCTVASIPTAEFGDVLGCSLATTLFVVPALLFGTPAVVVKKQLFGDDSEKAVSLYRRAALLKQLLKPDTDAKSCRKLKFPNLVQTDARDIGKLLDDAKEEATALAKLKQEQEQEQRHAAEKKQREQYRKLGNGLR